ARHEEKNAEAHPRRGRLEIRPQLARRQGTNGFFLKDHAARWLRVSSWNACSSVGRSSLSAKIGQRFSTASAKTSSRRSRPLDSRLKPSFITITTTLEPESAERAASASAGG